MYLCFRLKIRIIHIRRKDLIINNNNNPPASKSRGIYRAIKKIRAYIPMIPLGNPHPTLSSPILTN